MIPTKDSQRLVKQVRAALRPQALAHRNLLIVQWLFDEAHCRFGSRGEACIAVSRTLLSRLIDLPACGLCLLAWPCFFFCGIERRSCSSLQSRASRLRSPGNRNGVELLPCCSRSSKFAKAALTAARCCVCRVWHLNLGCRTECLQHRPICSADPDLEEEMACLLPFLSGLRELYAALICWVSVAWSRLRYLVGEAPLR